MPPSHFNSKSKACKKCNKVKPAQSFKKNKTTGIYHDICITCVGGPQVKWMTCENCNQTLASVDFPYLDASKKQGRSFNCRDCSGTRVAKYKECKSCHQVKPYNQYKEGKFEVCKDCRPQWFADYIKWAQETATHQNCNKCKIDKPFADFPRSKRRKYFPYDTICRKCVLEAYPNHLKHNVSREDFARMKEEQNYRCYICNRHEDEFRNSKGSFQVDHNHQHCPGEKSCGDEKCVRRLLCARCNNGLGCYDDNISRMLTAIVYVNDYDLEPQKIDVSPEVREKLLVMLGLG